jgi:hypothetical protein
MSALQKLKALMAGENIGAPALGEPSKPSKAPFDPFEGEAGTRISKIEGAGRQANPHLFFAADGTAWLSDRLRDLYDGRAAILEFDGGMSREKANHAAWIEVMRSEGIAVHDS